MGGRRNDGDFVRHSRVPVGWWPTKSSTLANAVNPFRQIFLATTFLAIVSRSHPFADYFREIRILEPCEIFRSFGSTCQPTTDR